MTLTVELPEDVVQELHNRHISDRSVHQFVVQAVKLWLNFSTDLDQTYSNNSSSLFAESALPFVDQLINENQQLFERLAKL